MEEISTRRKIYEAIALNPGLHFREIQRRSNIPVGVLEYHLMVLEREGMIVSKIDGKYRRYFANTTMTIEERKIMGALRDTISRRIVIFLIEQVKVKHSEIANHLKISPSTLSYHISKLMKYGIILKEIDGRETYYSVKDRDNLARVIIKYRKSFLDSLVDNFAEWFLKN